MLCLLIFITIVVCAGRNIGQVHVTFNGVTIPAKHKRNSLEELDMVSSINAACVYLKILYLILLRLISIKLKFDITSLALAKSIC
jgi:hypothetical protein